ncbi:MAG: HAMP domain-containing protein [Prevotella sp.]|nr:HAMP domain-containing protein [Prevotella sp.]
MKRLMTYIQQHLSLRLGLLILLVVGGVFCVSLSILFYESKQQVRQDAVHRATQALDETVLHISAIMDQTEEATTEMESVIQRHLQPDSLLVYSRRMLELHPDILGFTIAMKPDFFPKYGRSFSAYSLRQGDSITTVIEQHNYFEQEWYKNPWEKKRAIWMEPYIDDAPGILTSSEYNYSYVKPLYNSDGEPVGVLCTDLLLKWLSQAVTTVKAYPNSSAIMLGHDGRYIVHPDTAKLVRETIFSDPDPQASKDVIALGHSMLEGQSGIWQMIVDGNPAHIFYRPLERTGWSIAIVCPDSDVFSGYNRLLYTTWAVISLSLLLLLIICYQIIRRAIAPLNQLAVSAQRIADGHFDETLPHSNRLDTVGQLQNSFVVMQQSLAEHVSEIQQINAEMEQQNQALQHAYHLAREADIRKTAFVQDMAHQIRTPLNIINGFTQVLSIVSHEISEKELTDITSRMKSSSKAIKHITRMLIASSIGDSQLTTEQTTFSCNKLCHEAAASITLSNPDNVRIVVESDMPDTFMIRTDKKALLSILDELLDNANKFTHEGCITIGCRQPHANTIIFTVSDTGPGIPEAERNRIFNQFTKLDAFSEGIGLGLSLSQQTARLLGGSISLDESYTCGSRFIITLPI